MLDFPRANISARGLADWLETTVLFGDQPLSAATTIDLLMEDSGLDDVYEYDDYYAPEFDDEPTVLPDRYTGVMAIEALVADAFIELEFRSQIIGDGYPIATGADLVSRSVNDWHDAAAYSFLLALNARYIHGLEANTNVGARLFERLAAIAVREYWKGESVHFGSPRDDQSGKQFGDAIKKLAKDMNERLLWDREELPNHTGDMTVDVVAWRPLDTRRGHTVLLCQCAIGREWETKALDLGVWQHLISFAVEPSKCLAFPFVAEALIDFDDFRWEMLCARVGVPFDRLRLAGLLSQVSIPPELEDEMITWSASLASSLH